MKLRRPSASLQKTLLGLFAEALHALAAVQEALSTPGTEVVADLDRLRALLETLPLDKAEFALASNRLANVQAFLCQGETGAASFELRLLGKGIERNTPSDAPPCTAAAWLRK